MSQKQKQSQDKKKPRKPLSEAQIEARRKGGLETVRRNRSKGGKTTVYRNRQKGGRNSVASQKEKMGEESWLKFKKDSAIKAGKAKAGLPMKKGLTREKWTKSQAEAKERCVTDGNIPKEVQELMGISENPAQVLEHLMINENVPVKDRITCAKELMSYTFQKQATKQEITQEVVTHEAKLLELQQSLTSLEYKPEDDLYVAPLPPSTND